MSARMLQDMTSIRHNERRSSSRSESEISGAPTERAPSPFEADEAIADAPPTLPSLDIESSRSPK